MSSSIFNGVKDGVLFAIAADHQVIIICQNFAKHAAIHGKAHLCDVIFWNSLCGFDVLCGKNPTLLDFLPARQITGAGSV